MRNPAPVSDARCRRSLLDSRQEELHADGDEEKAEYSRHRVDSGVAEKTHHRSCRSQDAVGENERDDQANDHRDVNQSEVVWADAPDPALPPSERRKSIPAPQDWAWRAAVNAISGSLASGLSDPGATGLGNSIRKPITAMMRPPATLSPAIDMPKKSMIAAPSSRKTARIREGVETGVESNLVARLLARACGQRDEHRCRAEGVHDRQQRPDRQNNGFPEDVDLPAPVKRLCAIGPRNAPAHPRGSIRFNPET